MRVEIKRNDGKAIGWSITAETEEEKQTLNIMRDLIFWGLDDDVVDYAGRIDDESKENIQSLHWVKKKFKNFIRKDG
jgi:hypothetical protein